MPTLTAKRLSACSFEIPVLVVTGDPLNTIAAVDRLYTLADAIADVLGESSYRPSTWASSSRVEPLPALEVLATVTVSTEEE